MFQSLLTSKTVKIAAALAGLVVLAATAVAATGRPGAADTSGTIAKSIILGKTPSYPTPACATASNCQVIARVSGIQMAADGVRQPFLVPQNGQLVSWWLQLPKLSDTQIKSFNKLFRGTSAARIGVFRRGLKGRYRLLRQSDSVELQDKFGSKGRVTLRLGQPLPVKKGDFIGLSSVTWIPSFAVGLSGKRNSWLASRGRDRCATPSSRDLKKFERYYRHNDAQLQTSTAKPWQCTYDTARLIYWARVVPDATAPDQGGTDKPKEKKKR